MDIDKLVGERLTADTDFQSKLAALPEDQRPAATDVRRKEILADEFTKRDTIAGDQRRRAEKAETDLEDLRKKPPQPAADPELTQDQMYALAHRGVHPDDVPEVKKAMKFLGISDLDKVLADPLTAAHLATRIEKRKSAGAADMGGGKGGQAGKSDSEIAADAMKGDKLPEKGSADAEALFRARHPLQGERK